MPTEAVIGADGNVALVLGGGLSLVNAHFTGHFASARSGPSASFYLIDQSGTIVTYGHAVGEQVLCESAQRPRLAVRLVDCVARQAGDAFVIIFESLDGRASVDPSCKSCRPRSGHRPTALPGVWR